MHLRIFLGQAILKHRARVILPDGRDHKESGESGPKFFRAPKVPQKILEWQILAYFGHLTHYFALFLLKTHYIITSTRHPVIGAVV